MVQDVGAEADLALRLSDGSVNERYIVVVKWSKFQHYKKQTRPAWIKCYTALLHDDAYLSLTETQRAVLHGLWLLYAASGRQIPENTSKLSAKLSLRVTKPTLKRLEQAGFIRFRSRVGLEKPYARVEEKRIEKGLLLTVARPLQQNGTANPNLIEEEHGLLGS